MPNYYIITKKRSDILFTRKDLLNLIIPLLIEQLLATTIGMADTIMVASVGETAVSAVGLVDSLNMLLINIFAAIATGASVVISQYIGFNDKKTANLAASQAILASVLLSGVIMLVCLISGDRMLVFLFGKSEQAILDNSSIYFLLSAISYPFLAVQGTCSAVFRSIRNSRITMYVSILMNIVNVTGNAILIYGFGMGVEGAAIPTLLSRVIGACIMIYLLLDRRRIINLREAFTLKLNLNILKKIFSIGIPAGTETVIFQCGKVLTQNYVTHFGTAAITANTVTNSLFTLTSMPGNALNLAIVTIVGQCIGAGKYKEAKDYTIKIVIVGALALTCTNLTLFLLSAPALSLFKITAETADIVRTLILYNCIAQSIFWAVAFILPNALRGSGDVKYTMMVSIASMWIFRVGGGYILALVMGLGVVGVWLAMFIDWIFRALFFLIRFMSNKWMEKKVV